MKCRRSYSSPSLLMHPMVSEDGDDWLRRIHENSHHITVYILPRSCNDLAFFNTLFVSLGIASPVVRPFSSSSWMCSYGRVLSDPWRSRRVSTIDSPDRPFALVVAHPPTKRIQAYVPTRWRHVLSVHPPINRRTSGDPGSTMFDEFRSLDARLYKGPKGRSVSFF